MKAAVKFNPLTSLVVAAALAIGLAACGGGSSTTQEPVAPSEPTAEELRQQRVLAQTTLITSASQGLTTALAGLDTDAPTSAQIAAVDTAISLLRDALAGADDLSPNQTADARSQLSGAMTTVATARTTRGDASDLADRRKEQMDDISDAQDDLSDALDALMDDDAASITAVNGAITALQRAVDAADDLTDAEKTSAMSDLRDAEVDAARAELAMYTANAMAEGASDEDMLEAYEGKLEAATRLAAALRANNGSAADIDDANQAVGNAEAKIVSLKEDIQDAKDAEDNKTRLANNAASMKVAEAITAIKGTDLADTPTLFEIDTPADASDADFGIKRTSGNAMFSLNQTADEKKAMPYTPSSAPSAGTAWMGSTYTGSGTGTKRPFTEMARVYTDIEMAGDIAWTTLTGTGLSVASTGVATLTSGSPIDVVRLGGSILPSVPPADDDDGTTRNIGANGRVDGTLYGVSGQFSCATACTVTRSSEGTVSADQDLTFTPSSSSVASLMAKYADPDTDYTYFGYWMKSTTQRDDTKTHMIDTFHGGMGTTALATGSIGAILGTAKYFGAAAGLYVKKDGAGDSLVVTDGTFTANAELTADFGGDDIAANKHNMVSGIISVFMDGSTELGFADLVLGAATIDVTAADVAAGLGSFSGETDGGGTSGNWEGQFYGNLNPTPSGGTDDFTDDYPVNVSGEFTGHFTNGHVAGAFGAEYDQ